MLLDGNDPNLLAYDRRQKYFSKGNKFYAARVRLLKDHRYLRKRFRTASKAEEYGKAAIERYKNLLKAKGTLETFLKSYVVFRLGPLAVIWVRGEWIKSLWPRRQKG
jgi:hypothetical protein